MKRFILYLILTLSFVVASLLYSPRPVSAASCPAPGATRCNGYTKQVCISFTWTNNGTCPCGCTMAPGYASCLSCCIFCDDCICGQQSNQSGGFCLACPTPTPTPCIPQCNYYKCPYGCSSNTCDGGVCKAAPTSAPTTTVSPSASPTPVIGASCVGLEGKYNCSGNTSYYCVQYSSTVSIWEYNQTCYFNCPGSSTNKCNATTGRCCADQSTAGYCTTYTPGSNPPSCISCPGDPTKYTQYCYSSYSSYLDDSRQFSYLSCAGNINCGCTPLYDTCGGNANNCPALTGDPTSVSHINNCNDVYCGPPCTPGSTPVASLPPTPTATPAPATIRARAMLVTPLDTSCTTVRASTTGVDGTILQFTPSSASQPTAQQQIGTSYVTFSNIDSGTYIINPQSPAQYVLARACWSKTSGTSGEGLAEVLAGGNTLTWDLGYTLGTAWSQIQGGDAYASAALQSYIPAPASPRVFITDGPGGYPGIATYGVSYDFDSNGLAAGAGYVSRTNWLVNDTLAATDFYQLMLRRFGGVPAVVDYDYPAAPVPQPASRAKPYYVNNHMTTQGDWSVGSGQTLIFIVDGNLTIGGKVNITGNGFVAFIVNGNITIDPSVGVPFDSSSPAIEGVYITSPTGTFLTGTSTVADTERFVGRGMFVAGSFLLQRDLEPLGVNLNTAAELFVYHPQLMLSMPDAMKEMSISWQEVAP